MSDLLKVNVNEKTEKKNGLTYLSWAWAWAEVLKIDPHATWEASEFNGLPCAFLPDSSAMVKTFVTIKGHTKSCWLPVMDHRNKAIKNPDAFAINTAIVRCLTKTISMHGLGLYIYAGEDLPEDAEGATEAPKKTKSTAQEAADITPLSSEQSRIAAEAGGDIVAAFDDGRQTEALKIWRSIDDNDIKVHLWAFLAGAPKIRSFIKANQAKAQ